MNTPNKELQLAYAPLQQALQQLHAPDALEPSLLLAYRRQYAKPGRLARLRAWFAQERGLWLPLGGACLAALAAMLWLRPLLMQRGPLAPSAIEMAAQQPRADEQMTAFFPVGDPALLQAADHARMVRVSLPRSVLVSYGLPVNPALADQEINADVLVADDGTTLALRFVRSNHHLM